MRPRRAHPAQGMKVSGSAFAASAAFRPQRFFRSPVPRGAARRVEVPQVDLADLVVARGWPTDPGARCRERRRRPARISRPGARLPQGDGASRRRPAHRFPPRRRQQQRGGGEGPTGGSASYSGVHASAIPPRSGGPGPNFITVSPVSGSSPLRSSDSFQACDPARRHRSRQSATLNSRRPAAGRGTGPAKSSGCRW